MGHSQRRSPKPYLVLPPPAATVQGANGLLTAIYTTCPAQNPDAHAH